MPLELGLAELIVAGLRSHETWLALQVISEVSTAISLFFSEKEWPTNPLDVKSDFLSTKQQRADMRLVDSLMRGEGPSGYKDCVRDGAKHFKSVMMFRAGPKATPTSAQTQGRRYYGTLCMRYLWEGIRMFQECHHLSLASDGTRRPIAAIAGA